MKGKVFVTWECIYDDCERDNPNHPTCGQKSTGNPTLDEAIARRLGRNHLKRVHGDFTSEPKIIKVLDAENIKLYGNSGKFRRDIIGKTAKMETMEQNSNLQKV